MPKPLFRPAQVTDVNPLHHGIEKTFIPLLDRFYKNGFYPYYANRKWIEDKIKNQFVYVIELDEKVAGAVFIHKNPDRLNLYIHTLYINEGLRRRGLGTFLMLNTQALHSDALTWRLETLADLPASIAFFEKLKYIPYGAPKLVNGSMTVVYYHKQ